MPQLAVLRPFDEGHLHDDPRLYPVRPQLRQPLRSRERRLGNLDAVESCTQLEQQLRVESCADLAGVDEVVSVIVADEQRTEADATALRIREPADDQLLGFLA